MPPVCFGLLQYIGILERNFLKVAKGWQGLKNTRNTGKEKTQLTSKQRMLSVKEMKNMKRLETKKNKNY